MNTAENMYMYMEKWYMDMDMHTLKYIFNTNPCMIDRIHTLGTHGVQSICPTVTSAKLVNRYSKDYRQNTEKQTQ